MSNKKTGTTFEYKFARLLSGNGFWVHRLQDNHNGQPFDLIACISGRAYAFDCKDCQNDTFSLSRIEENQRNAMTLWEECGNGDGLFAFHVSQGIRIIPFSVLLFLESKEIKTINKSDLMWYSVSAKQWIEERV